MSDDTNNQSIISGDVAGCIDDSALNYDPNATTDDGSCVLECVGQGCCLYAEPDHYLLGDGDFDEDVDILDVLLMVNLMLGTADTTAEQQCSVDSN